MLDRPLRRLLAPTLDATARRLAGTGVRPGHLTAAGLLIGLGAAGAAAAGEWTLAGVCWLLSRLADGLDGPLARARGTADEVGGLADLLADFTVYAAFVVGVAVARPDARLAAVVLLAAYYLNAASLLSWSALATRRGLATDGRSLHLGGDLAEGTETIVVYLAVAAFPHRAATLFWAFAGLVGLTTILRTVRSARAFRTMVPQQPRGVR
jgi:phosphatidylglycerophosphate synthase